MRTIAILDATAPGVVCGRHAIWAPELALKVPFSWGGRITKYGHAEPGYDPAETIPHELSILRALAAEGMAPPVGGMVHVQTLVSKYPGAWHADPCGAWGYEMADATKLPPGRFSIERMRELPISGSAGAWGDIGKTGNVVNGYLVDVRRSAWDMLRWTGGGLPEMPRLEQDFDVLRARVHRECQFPAGERAEAYQDFWLNGELHRGQRRVVERAEGIGFAPHPGESVLDIGAQAGGFLQLAALCGASRIAGAEMNSNYVSCARSLARSCTQNICIREMDVITEREAFLGWVRSYFPEGIDHLLLLSMEKHLGEQAMFSLIDELGARRTYIETNAVANHDGAAAPMKLWPEIQRRGGCHVGNSCDRNIRRLYRIEVP